MRHSAHMLIAASKIYLTRGSLSLVEVLLYQISGTAIPTFAPYCNPEPNPSHYIGGSSQEVPRREVAKERKDARRGSKTTVASRSKYNSYLVYSGRGCRI
jgi:hypothetical protein